ncbi:hypothetical protein [Candidatus Pantoea persica]|nr:hypothetical protein [Candidatus Pantoea persica]
MMEVDPRYTQDISVLDQMFVINERGQGDSAVVVRPLSARQRASLGKP